MGNRLREIRTALGWSQSQLIDQLLDTGDRLGLTPLPSQSSFKTLVSMYENGRRPVGEEHRALFREVYQRTDAELGFGVEERPLVAPAADALSPSPGAPKLPSAVNPEMLAYLSAVLQQHTAAEPLIGPQFLVPTVQSQMPLIDQMCHEARGPIRDDVLRVGSRYAEFLGWLYQDTGQTELAARWTGLAGDFAQELGDPMLLAYVLQRRSNIATEAGYAGHGAGLANAALRHEKGLTPRVRAVVLRQLANSKAGLGEAAEVDRAVDAALEAAASGEDSDPLAGFCSVAYIQMESANSAVRLERPEPAAETFRASLTHWPAVQERDRGLCLARLATASALIEDVEEVATAGAEAASIAEKTGSARILGELVRLQTHLAPWRKLVEISELISAVERMKRAG